MALTQLKCLAMAAITCVCGIPSLAQLTAPTLSAGLTTVTGQRGELDVALLSQIISEKQEEVKREVLQRKILNRMEGESLALQNFVYSSFYALLSFKDTKAIEKELLKQMSVLALEVGFTEALLRVSAINPRDDKNVSAAITELARQNPALGHKSDLISSELKSSLRKYMVEAYGLGGNALDTAYSKLVRKLQEPAFSKLFSIDRYLDEATGKNLGKSQTRFSAILLDVVYDVVLRDTTLQERGFGHIHPSLSSHYNALNLSKHNTAGDNGATHVSFPELEHLVQSTMSVFVTYHPLFFDFVEQGGFSLRQLQNIRMEAANTATSSIPFTEQLNSLQRTAMQLGSAFKEMGNDSRLNPGSLKQLQNDLETILNGIAQLQTRNPDKTSVRVNDYYFIRQYVDPFVAKMITLGMLDESELSEIEAIKNNIFLALITKLNRQLESDSNLMLLDDVSFEKYGHLIKIIFSLSRLDEVGSYEQIFNTLAQVGINSVGDTKLKFVQDIVYYVEAYASIDRAQNRLNIEVESLLLKILSLYENRTSSDFQLYFGVGMGQTLDVNYDAGYSLMTSQDSAQVVLDNLSFASEKVGMKLKLINNKRIQSMEENELTWFLPKLVHSNKVHHNQTPIISDLYVFAYGSGLLYNIADLTTAGKDFNYSMIGFGGGMAFFNALDLNIWWASPMVGGESFGQSLDRRTLFGISFDVKLTEYLSALGDKRRKAQLSK